MGIFLSLSLSFILFRFLSSLRCVYSMRNLRGEEEKKKKEKKNKQMERAGQRDAEFLFKLRIPWQIDFKNYCFIN